MEFTGIYIAALVLLWVACAATSAEVTIRCWKCVREDVSLFKQFFVCWMIATGCMTCSGGAVYLGTMAIYKIQGNQNERQEQQEI